MVSLIVRNIQEDYPTFEEELKSYGANFIDIMKLLLINKKRIYFNISVICFGRALSEYGAAAIVGGSIDHLTRNITVTIAQETSKGNLLLALQLGIILVSISFILSFIIQMNNKN